MINIKQNQSNTFSIFKSNFDFDFTKNYILKFKNDISLSEYTTELVYEIDNINYTSIKINEIGQNGFYSTSGDIKLPNLGFYTLNIFNELNEIEYNERVLVKGVESIVNYNDDEIIIIDEVPDNYTICSTIANCDVIKNKLDKSEYRDSSTMGFATQIYVDEEVNIINSRIDGIVVGVSPDYTTAGLATTSYVDNEIANIDVDLTGYATTSYVDNEIANIDVDLTGYATTSYVDNEIANIDVDYNDYTTAGLATVQYVDNEIANIDFNYNDYTTAGLATVQYVDNEIANIDSEKQNILISAVNIKTLNGNSILGPGNLTVSASLPFTNILHGRYRGTNNNGGNIAHRTINIPIGTTLPTTTYTVIITPIKVFTWDTYFTITTGYDAVGSNPYIVYIDSRTTTTFSVKAFYNAFPVSHVYLDWMIIY